MEIELREYTSDSTAEEIEMLRNRVNYLDGIIFFDETPVVSIFQTDLMWDRVEELIEEDKDNYLLVNLVNSKPPNAPQRARIRERLKSIRTNIKYAAFYTQKNILINLTAKFILGNTKFLNTSIFKTREQALKAIEKAKNR